MATAAANGIQIEYDTFGDPASPALLLVAGLGSQLTYWQEAFCQEIADSGYHVIRYDNRDTGLSTKFEGLGVHELMDAINALTLGHNVAVPYTIRDMTDDAVGLLDALSVEKVHVCGMSMGGFIAQTFAINHPSRTLSLTSIYSTTGNRTQFPPTQAVAEAMMVPVPEAREPYIAYMLDFFRLTYGTGLPFDEDFHRAVFEQAYDRSLCPEGSLRQLLAISTQEDRTSKLGKLKIPALVIHGDADPLVPLSGGRATAEAIPDAAFMVVAGMGHALPNLNAYWDKIKAAVINHMANAS